MDRIAHEHDNGSVQDRMGALASYLTGKDKA